MNSAQQRLRIFLWLVAIVLGGLHARAGIALHAMTPDGIAYLDLGDAYWRGNWKEAINGYWGPLYPWLLGCFMKILRPALYWEVAVVQLANFVIYLFALVCFDFFWRELMRYRRGNSSDGTLMFPDWAWMGLGYGLFIWSSLELIKVWRISPDLLVAALAYLIGALFLRIRVGAGKWGTAALLGVALGFSYFARASMLLLALVFLAAHVLSMSNPRRAIPLTLVSLFFLIMAAGPFIVALSRAKGHLTIGDSSKLNYAWSVNGIPKVHWQGLPADSGRPEHATRRISMLPAIYEFGAPVGGTYSPWYDPSYWNEGVHLRLDLRRQLGVLASNAQVYFDLFFHRLGGLVMGVFVLFFFCGTKWAFLKEIGSQSYLLIPALVALGGYSLVPVESREVAPFVVLVWAGILAGTRLSDSLESTRLLASVSMGMLVFLIIHISAFNLGGHLSRGIYYPAINELETLPEAYPHLQFEVAQGLIQMGIKPGDRVACLGESFNAYWARLARVRIVAEMASKDVDGYWLADVPVRSQVIKTFASTRAGAIIAERVPSHGLVDGWRRIGNTNHYAYLFL